MSLKPIDYQVMLPKANEVSRDLSGQLSKYNAIQKQQADRVKDNAEEEQKQVRDRENIHKARIERQEERKGHQQGKRQQHENEDEDKEGKGKKKEMGVTIDIRL